MSSINMNFIYDELATLCANNKLCDDCPVHKADNAHKCGRGYTFYDKSVLKNDAMTYYTSYVCNNFDDSSSELHDVNISDMIKDVVGTNFDGYANGIECAMLLDKMNKALSGVE